MILNEEAIGRFRTNYATAFGGIDRNDPLYESVTGGRRPQGVEHWLPLLAGQARDTCSIMPAMRSYRSTMRRRIRRLQGASRSRNSTTARQEALGLESFGAQTYKPLPPERLYLSADGMGGDARRPYGAADFAV